jgi:hypothetical protein
VFCRALGNTVGVTRISERDWSEIRESDYEDADDYCAACLIDLSAKSEEKTKERCKLPVREPRSLGGRLNRNAVHAAAAVLAGGRGGVEAPAAEKRKAARKLVRLYRELDEDPPDSLRKLARS